MFSDSLSFHSHHFLGHTRSVSKHLAALEVHKQIVIIVPLGVYKTK